MPKPMLYPKAITVRVDADVPERIKALRSHDKEPITSVQRRVIQAGLEALETAALDAAERDAPAPRAKRAAGKRGGKGEST